MATYLKRSSLAAAIIVAIIGASAASEPPRFTDAIDPFSYCADIRTTDSPAGGTGPSPVPRALEPYLPAALGLPTGAAIAAGSAYWRCMDRMVYVCVTGANLVCDRKADRATTNAGADSFCRDNPEAAAVPAYATGHDSVYTWHCRAGRSLHGEPSVALDRRGFRIDIWHKISRAQGTAERP